MGTGTQKEDINALKEKLKTLDDFIRTAEKEYSQELKECRQDYQEACDNLEEAKREYQEDLEMAKVDGYGPDQLRNLHKLNRENIESAEKYQQEALTFLKAAQERMDGLPKLLNEAKAAKKATETRIALLEPCAHRSKNVVGGAAIWIIIIAVLLKACGG